MWSRGGKKGEILSTTGNTKTGQFVSQGEVRGLRRTWLVHTLLKATNANVCASIVPARSFLASARGSRTAERLSWGMNARDSKCIFEKILLGNEEDCAGNEEAAEVR